jgi:hypothetical protein
LPELEADRSNVNGPAGGFRAPKASPYSSQPARPSRKLLPIKIFFIETLLFFRLRGRHERFTSDLSA